MSTENTAASTGTSTNQSTTTTNTSETPKGWTDGFDTDLKSYVDNKQFKTPKDALESYRNLEKLMGAPKERLLTLPEKMDSPEANAIWERLGAHKDANEYKFDTQKEVEDKELEAWAKETFHKLKMPRQMAEGFMKALDARTLTDLKSMAENNQLLAKQESDGLKKEWGAAFEQNKNIADNAATKFGFSNDEIKSLGAALGPAKAMKFLHKLGASVGEDSFVVGNTVESKMLTPAQAQNQIKELMKDTDFTRRLSNKDMAAKEKWNKLHEFAFPGEYTI